MVTANDLCSSLKGDDRICRRQERGRGRGRGHGVASDGSASSSSQTFGRSVPFPTQRSFGLPRLHQSAQEMRILEQQAAAKALEWRKRLGTMLFIAVFHILLYSRGSPQQFTMAVVFALSMLQELFFLKDLGGFFFSLPTYVVFCSIYNKGLKARPFEFGRRSMFTQVG